MNPLDNLTFQNRFYESLPADDNQENYPRQVEKACYSRVDCKKASKPQLVAYSPEAASLLDLDPASCESKQFSEVFSGNAMLAGMASYSMCYGGHQFGNWAGQLGDGRAINLGEVKNKNKVHYALQLKGAGPTPYSRAGDGLAVLRSSVREFLCSEAMFHLGIPTTRALSLILTGDEVLRDMFYDGNARYEPGAVVCRVSESFIRFGNFEIFTARGDFENLKRLADFTIANHYSHLGAKGKETYLAWFEEICQRTADLMVDWLRVGFVHGVMNTDNMSILGETIDYGPYGWVEDYHPLFTPNTTDAAGKRYAFAKQPGMAQFNLVQLGNAIYPLVEDAGALNQILENFSGYFSKQWQKMMLAKLGLENFTGEAADTLVTDLLNLLARVETDYTLFFRRLAEIDLNQEVEQLLHQLQSVYYTPNELTDDYKQQFQRWMLDYIKQVRTQSLTAEDRKKKMNQVNPWFILRNYLGQEAIEKAEKGDFSMIHQLFEALKNPYEVQEDKLAFAQKRPEWARTRAGCSMLSCSS